MLISKRLEYIVARIVFAMMKIEIIISAATTAIEMMPTRLLTDDSLFANSRRSFMLSTPSIF